MAKSVEKQMELFADGGLNDEGGMVDEVSGNEVPPGSTREEVRDDIPANLSEGEFVFPADVVRYFGLETLMKMRQEAKMGLQRMEDMGQMGNSDEAIMPDDLPFSIEDLDMEDDDEEMNFAVGGFAANTASNNMLGNVVGSLAGTVGNQPNVNLPNQPTVMQPFQPVPIQPPVAASSQFAPGYTPPQQQYTPTRLPTAVLPTMGQVIGAGVPNVDWEWVTYTNEAGQTVKLRKSKSTGEILDPIPEGYKPEGEAGTGTDTTGVQTAKVSDAGGGDSQDYGGGTSLITGEKIAGYSPEEIKTGVTTAKDRYAITGRRGFDLLNVIPGGSFIKGLFPESSMNIFGKEPTIPEDASVPPGIGMPVAAMQARSNLEGILGTGITGYVGFEKGDLDPNSGGFFNSRGVAVDKDGNPTKNENGTSNFSSFSDFKSHMSAAVESGWYGGELGTKEAGKLKGTAAEKYAAYEKALNKEYATEKPAEKEKTSSGYPSGVTQRSYDKETASEAAAREAANREQAARQQAARDERDNSDRDDGVGESEGGGYGSDAGTGGGGDMGVICLTEDMKVKLNGVINFVTNVKVGDILDNTTVTEVLHKHMREGYYVVNGELKITNDHPVLANGSWKRTEDLVLGDYINNVEVTSLEYVEQVTPTVYIGTADDRYDVYTEGKVYTVHGQYKNVLKKAA